MAGSEGQGFVHLRVRSAYSLLEGAIKTGEIGKLAAREGIFGGFSSGANVAAALQLLQGEMRGKTLAVVICDSGLKYLSTDLW